MPRLHVIRGMSNTEFLEAFAAPGRVGLSGGLSLGSRLIGFAQRHVHKHKRPSRWSHAFLFQGRRLDGAHWVMESDMEVHRSHLRFGVQENRISKYANEEYYGRLAVMDFGLSPETTDTILGEGLEMISGHIRYSLLELMGTLTALRHPSLLKRPNFLAGKQSVFCSAFVQHVYRRAGIDLVPGLELKHTTPEHIARSVVPHTIWMLKRPAQSAGSAAAI